MSVLDGSRSLVRLARTLGLTAVALMAFGAPAAYLYFGHQRIGGELKGELQHKARQVNQLISGNPEFWQFEDLRIGEIIRNSDEHSGAVFSKVIDNAHETVAQVPEQRPDFAWPVLTRQEQLFDYGQPIGKVEMTRSLESLYRQTIVIGAFSLLAGALFWWALRIVPLRLLQGAWSRISYLASHDSLTGLPNRVLFIDRLEHALAKAERPRSPVTVYALDLDHFKDINDTLGHGAGDLLLKQAAERMQACLRAEDTLARLGGDEFAIIQTGIEEPQAAAALAERVIAQMSKPFELNGHDAVIGVSIGIAFNSADGTTDPDEILKNSDLALYKSKATGRDNFHFFQEDMDAELRARKAMEYDLRKALAREELDLHYQPQVNLGTQKITAVEALLRWHHQERGDVPPAEFVPVAETMGLIRPLSEWVLHKACRDALNWPELRIAVNLSPTLFKQQGLVEMVERALDITGLAADRLELEVTEDILLADTERTLDILTRLKELGIHIAMDDFGTGYSSLSYLRRFPFDKIKIDRSFIHDADTNMDAQAIIRAIIGMSHALKMQINAEGVNTIEQAEMLRSAGCEEVQGFLFGRPMNKNDIDVVLGALRKTGVLELDRDVLALRA